jgi:hypothetical protein
MKGLTIPLLCIQYIYDFPVRASEDRDTNGLKGSRCLVYPDNLGIAFFEYTLQFRLIVLVSRLMATLQPGPAQGDSGGNHSDRIHAFTFLFFKDQTIKPNHLSDFLSVLAVYFIFKDDL